MSVMHQEYRSNAEHGDLPEHLSGTDYTAIHTNCYGTVDLLYKKKAKRGNEKQTDARVKRPLTAVVRKVVWTQLAFSINMEPVLVLEPVMV